MKKLAFLLIVPIIGCSESNNKQGDDNSNSIDETASSEEIIESAVEEINDNLPKAWFKAGDEPESYEMGTDSSVMKSGSNCAYIESKAEIIKGFGTMMQTCSAKEYIGQRIKLTGYIKSENVDEWSGMWLRIDPVKGHDELGFDNMQNRAIKGTQDWTLCEIVLDVPAESWTLNYGVLLSGKGKVWFDDFKFEVVDKNTPTTETSYLTSKSILDIPSNIGFEE